MLTPLLTMPSFSCPPSTNATLIESIPPISTSHPKMKPQSDINLVKGAKKNAQNRPSNGLKMKRKEKNAEAEIYKGC